MSKVILVMDSLPESCDKCPFFDDYSYRDLNCRAQNKRTIDYPYPENFRQEWCPLKPMPEKYNIEEDRKKPHDGGYTWEYYENGYNACINEILDEGE